MNAAVRLSLNEEQLAFVCQKHRVARLSIFGSVVRDDFGPRSDVDVLVEFEEGAPADLWALAGLRADLADLFERDVDVTMPRILSKYIKKRVLDSAETIYVRR